MARAFLNRFAPLAWGEGGLRNGVRHTVFKPVSLKKYTKNSLIKPG